MLRFTNHPTETSDHKRAKNLRRDASSYERKLWAAVRKTAAPKKLKFRFQQPIPPYFADFACMEARLIIELDGWSHDSSQSYDRQREDYLKRQGFTVIRFTNDEVKENLDGVVQSIIEQAEKVIPKPNT